MEPSSTESLAARMYPGPQPASGAPAPTTTQQAQPAPATTEDLAQRMYPGGALSGPHAPEVQALATELGLSRTEIASIGEGLTFAQSVRGDAQRIMAARESAVDLLNQEHGDQAKLAVRAARAYVAANPKLSAMLDRTGAGDAPQAIVLIARRALALHRAGKLTIPGSSPQESAESRGSAGDSGSSLAQRMFPGMNP
jgi:hypothetical protein